MIAIKLRAVIQCDHTWVRAGGSERWCSESASYELPADRRQSGSFEMHALEHFKRLGWKVVDDTTLCPDCANKRADESSVIKATDWKRKLDVILELEEKANYDSSESMAESLIEEFTEEEQSEFCYEITDAIEEWWAAND